MLPILIALREIFSFPNLIKMPFNTKTHIRPKKGGEGRVSVSHSAHWQFTDLDFHYLWRKVCSRNSLSTFENWNGVGVYGWRRTTLPWNLTDLNAEFEMFGSFGLRFSLLVRLRDAPSEVVVPKKLFLPYNSWCISHAIPSTRWYSRWCRRWWYVCNNNTQHSHAKHSRERWCPFSFGG